MKKKFSLFQIICLVVLFVSAISLITFKTLEKVKAAGPGDGVNMHVLVEGRTSSSNPWLNFSGNYSPGGATITANPGDIINFRIRVWNDGTVIADNAEISGTVTNTSYVSGLDIANYDLDGDGHHFTGFHFASGGDGKVAVVLNHGTPTTDYQGILGTITLGNNFPVGQTVIIGEVTVTNYEARGITFNPSLLGKAYAQEVGQKSAIRIVVNVAEPLPSTGKITTQDIASKVANYLGR
jgi:hypothetical protein